jgi:hypothetical protein
MDDQFPLCLFDHFRETGIQFQFLSRNVDLFHCHVQGVDFMALVRHRILLLHFLPHIYYDFPHNPSGNPDYSAIHEVNFAAFGRETDPQ